jgi:hypothetical protein
MTSTIKVNNIQNQCGANIINESSNTITIGASGDTVSLASGASQSGFGRTGTVDWQTTVKTANFAAANGEGYFVNTTSGAITVTLPAGSAGDIVAFKDYASTWDTNAVTVTPNGTDKINGINASASLTTESQSVTLIFVDSTKGWLDVHDSTSKVSGANFITATGGTITTVCTNYKVHTFTGPGTFTVCSVGNPSGSDTVSYMVVAGGGGGGGSASGTAGGAGGGGAGGFREGRTSQCNSWSASPLACTIGCNAGLPVTAQAYPITVGSGGAGNSADNGNPGNNSIFSTITSTGGGGAGARSPADPGGNGSNGGSGGGGGHGTTGSPHPAGTGNTPPVSPPQGNPGADFPSGGFGGGGGGGAGAAATNANGANGVTSSINATPTARAGGGAGANSSGAGTGGSGGGGCATGANGSVGCAGAANTGGGGGGSGNAATSPNIAGAAGGSGIVIIRYRFQ